MKLTEIIKQFVLQNDTDFAILINGQWGSGKTFFLKDEVAKTLSHLTCKISETNNKPCQLLYVSLYGAKSTDEVERRLMLAANPILSTKTWKVASGLVAKVGQLFNVDVTDKEQKDLVNIFGGIPKNRVIVFDDLERLESDTLNEVLGFINSYTEHQKLKVIIVADEEKLKEKLGKEYSSTKEKLIRFSYLYQPKLDEVFLNFTHRYPNESYRKFLAERQDRICTLFEKASHNNLRTLRFVLDLFSMVFDQLHNDKGIRDEYRIPILDRFLLFLITYSIALKQGAESEELASLESLSLHIDSPPNISLFGLFESDEIQSVNPEPAKSTTEAFKEEFEKKFIPNNSNEFEYFQPLAHYIHSGDLNTKKLNAEAAEIERRLIEKEQKPAQIVLNKLNNCLLLNDGEYTPLVQDILGYVQAGEYPLETYPSIFQQLLYGANNNLEGIEVNNSTVDIFKQGMIKATTTSTYKIGYNKIQNISTLKGYKLLREVTDYGKELNESILAMQDQDYAKKVMELMQTNRLGDLSEFMIHDDVQANPVFQIKYISPGEFLKRFLLLSNKDKIKALEVLQQFSGRFINYIGSLRQEKEFWLDFHKLVEDEINKVGEVHQFSTQILTTLKVRIESFLKWLE